MPFDGFSDDTTFAAHRDSDPDAQRHRSRDKRRAGRGAGQPPPGPADPPASPAQPVAPEPPRPSGPPPEPSGPPPEPARRKRGLPPSGKYPPRPYRPRRWQRSHLPATDNSWYDVFLEAYSRWGVVDRACEVAGICRKTVIKRRHTDPEFAAAYSEAYESFRDHLRAEGYRKLFEGDDVWTYNDKAGGLVYGGKRKSDLIFMFMVKEAIRSFRDSYQGDERPPTEAISDIFVKFLKGFDPKSDDQSSSPSLDDFMMPPAPLAIEGPVETVEAKRRRLLAELAALDAQEATAAPTEPT